MKKIFVLICMLICPNVFAQQGIRVVNPDKNTKIEIILKKPAKEFGGRLDFVVSKAELDLVLCDEADREIKRVKISDNGEYNFGELPQGRYFLRFDNCIKKNEPKEDKAQPYIMNLPYVRK